MCAIALFTLAAIVTRPAYAYSVPAASFLDFFDYKFDVAASQLFPSKQVEKDVISGRSSDFSIAKVDHNVMGFAISASEVQIHVQPSKIDSGETRLGMDMYGKNVAIDSGYLHKRYPSLHLDGIYGVYNAQTDRIAVHVPLSTALSLLLS